MTWATEEQIINEIRDVKTEIVSLSEKKKKRADLMLYVIWTVSPFNITHRQQKCNGKKLKMQRNVYA